MLPVVENCNDCGACCQHMGGTPSVLAYRTRKESVTSRLYGPKLPPELNSELLKQIEGWLAKDNWPGDVPCIWFDASTNKCRNYRYRPYVCRDFKVGCSACIEHRRDHEIRTARAAAS